jgi:soluble lytic murein transglycosylase-like protein
MKIAAFVLSIALSNHVPPPLLHGIIMVESRYECGLTSATGARGIGQVMPSTARGVGVTGNLYDCRIGAEAAARYLRLALNQSRGDWEGAATLYNQGLGSRPRHTSYSHNVMENTRW